VISRAFGLGRTPEPTLARDEAEKLISDITKEIEEMGYEDIWKKVAESMQTAEGEEGEIPPGMTRDEAFSALSVEILKSEVGELDDEEKLRDYLALINEITSAVERARSEKGVDSDVPVLVAVLPDTQELRETVETFERVIKGEANIRGLETVPVDDEWDGLKIEAIPHLDMILGKYRFWARKIETLLKSQSAWKIKRGLDKGAYFLGIEGQSVEISPSMVSFEILLPDNVVRRKFSGGSLYVSFPQTAEADDSTPSSGLAEGAEADGADELSITTEIVGRILEMRRDMNLEDEQRVEVKISVNEDLLAELESQKDRIARETNSKSLDFVTKENIEGEDGYTIEWQVADETFMISLRQSQEAGSPA
jgi:isoleucyl-tRNA synthetase